MKNIYNIVIFHIFCIVIILGVCCSGPVWLTHRTPGTRLKSIFFPILFVKVSQTQHKGFCITCLTCKFPRIPFWDINLSDTPEKRLEKCEEECFVPCVCPQAIVPRSVCLSSVCHTHVINDRSQIVMFSDLFAQHELRNWKALGKGTSAESACCLNNISLVNFQ